MIKVLQQESHPGFWDWPLFPSSRTLFVYTQTWRCEWCFHKIQDQMAFSPHQANDQPDLPMNPMEVNTNSNFIGRERFFFSCCFLPSAESSQFFSPPPSYVITWFPLGLDKTSYLCSMHWRDHPILTQFGNRPEVSTSDGNFHLGLMRKALEM